MIFTTKVLVLEQQVLIFANVVILQNLSKSQLPPFF